MSFLDRFKIQPKYKSADPEVRLVRHPRVRRDDAHRRGSRGHRRARPRGRRRAGSGAPRRAGSTTSRCSPASPGRRRTRASGTRSSIGSPASPRPRRPPTRRWPRSPRCGSRSRLARVAKSSPVDSVRAAAVGRLTDLEDAELGRPPCVRRARRRAGRVEKMEDPDRAPQHRDEDGAQGRRHRRAGARRLQGPRDPRAGGGPRQQQVGRQARPRDGAGDGRRRGGAEGRGRTARPARRVRHRERRNGGGVTGGCRGGRSAGRSSRPAGASWSRARRTRLPRPTGHDSTRRCVSAREGIDARSAGARRTRGPRGGARGRARRQDRPLRAGRSVLRRRRARSDRSGAIGVGRPGRRSRRGHHDALARRFQEACARARTRHDNRQDMARTQRAPRGALPRGRAARGAGRQPRLRVGRDLARMELAEGEVRRASTKPSSSASPRRQPSSRSGPRPRRPRRKRRIRQQVARVDQLIERVHKRAEAEDLTLKEADKAAKDLRAAIETPLTRAAPRARIPRRAAEGGARRARAEAPRAARDGRVEAVRQRRRPGRAHRAGRGAREEVRPREAGRHGEGGARAPRHPGALEDRGRSAARAGADALAPLPPGRGSDPGEGARVLCRARAGAGREPEEEAGALRSRRSAGRLHRLDQDRRGDEEAPGGMAGRRARPAPRHAHRLEAFPRRVRSLLLAAQRGPGAAQGSLVGRTRRRRKRSARAPRNWRSRASGNGRPARCGGSRPTGRRSDRCAAASRRRCGSASARRPTRSSIATSAATRSSSNRARPIAKGSSPSSRRCSPRKAPSAGPDLLETGALAAHAVEPVHDRGPLGSRSAQRPVRQRHRTAADVVPRAVQGHGARRRGEPAADGEARDARRNARDRTPSRSRIRRRISRRGCARRSRRTRSAGAPAKNRSGAALAEEVRQAQASFARLVPVPGETGRQLADRFHKACNRFFDQYRRKVPQAERGGAPQRGQRPVGAR